MTPAELRLFAWQGPFPPCSTCGRGQGRRCISSTGTLTPPHRPRVDAVAGWLARQPEVDAIKAELDAEHEAHDDLIAQLNEQVVAQAELTRQAEESRDIAQRRIGELVTELDDALEALAAADQTHADHMATHAPVTLFNKAPVRRVKIPAGARGGSASAGANSPYALTKPTTVADLHYEAMFETGFEWRRAGKLPGMVGVAPGISPTFPTGGKPDPNHDGFSTRLMWLDPTGGTMTMPDGSKHRAIAPAEIAAYMYHPGQRDLYGDYLWSNWVPPIGDWFKVRQHIVLNTPGQTDGVFRLWLNDRLVVDLDSFVFRTRDDVKLTHYLESVFAGGGDDTYTSTRDRYINIRNVTVTTPA